jgi:pimeloyl-ACP methyl ester carboxylesterase
MPYASVGNVKICYETFGDPSNQPMLLIMGLGMQLTGWDESLCKLLAAERFYVIRYDNRDAGMSTSFDQDAMPDPFAAAAGDTASLSYGLDDLASDAGGLLDVLGLPRAHIVGASMGGMVAQLVAIMRPGQVLSLASIMSTTGAPDVGTPTPEAVEALIQPGAAETRDETIEAIIDLHRAIGSPGYPLSDRQLRTFVTRDYERAHSNCGAIRHLCAVLAADDRTDLLREIQVPTVVIHGTDDPLVDISGGEATARAIPHAQFVVIKGMGHNMPSQKWPELVDVIVTNARKAN